MVRYVQLAHNVWDAERGQASAQVVHSFGRADALDVEALRRLAGSITRFTDPGSAAAGVPAAAGEGLLGFTGSVAMGGAWVLDALWSRLGFGAAIGSAVTGRRLDPRVERVLFALVANRALGAASSRPWIGPTRTCTCPAARVSARTRRCSTGRWMSWPSTTA